MPYSGPGDDKLPDAVQKLPKWQRELWVRVFNDEYDEDDEGAAFRAAWAAVRNAAESRKGIRKMLETLTIPTDQPASIFKTYRHPDGSLRWLGVTSGGFEDRDGEVVSTAFLRSAVEHADDTGQRGPLLIHHVPGTNIGTVDFQAVIGDPGFLLESGTFDDSEAGRAAAASLSKSIGQYGASIRFLYINRDAEGVYNPPGIIIERSVLPWDRAAFPWSTISAMSEVKSMTELDAEKRATLDAILGQDVAAQVLAKIEEGAEELKEAGIRWKEAVKDAPAAPVAEPVEGEAVEVEDDDEDEDSEPEGEELAEEKAANTPAETEIILTDELLAAIAEKQTAAVAGLIAPLVEGLTTLRAALDAQAQEIAALKRNEDERLAEKAANLPRATVRQIATYRPTVSKEAQPAEQEPEPLMKKGLASLYGG